MKICNLKLKQTEWMELEITVREQSRNKDRLKLLIFWKRMMIKLARRSTCKIRTWMVITRLKRMQQMAVRWLRQVMIMSIRLDQEIFSRFSHLKKILETFKMCLENFYNFKLNAKMQNFQQLEVIGQNTIM